MVDLDSTELENDSSVLGDEDEVGNPYSQSEHYLEEVVEMILVRA